MPLPQSPNSDSLHTYSTQPSSYPEYAIYKTIGRGGFGEVYLAATPNGETLALKKLVKANPKFDRTNLEREIIAGERLQHTNIIHHMTHFETMDSFFMVMEYFEGLDLLEFMRARKFNPLPEKNAKKLFMQLVSALWYCHQQGVAHRDVKLQNILVNRKGEIKLLDFGLCHFSAQQPGIFREKDCSVILGSLGYLAPEIASGKPYSGFAADVWSAGVVLYALLFGRLPFSDEQYPFLVNGQQLPLSWEGREISFECRNLLQSLLTVNPDTRVDFDHVLNHPWSSHN